MTRKILSLEDEVNCGKIKNVLFLRKTSLLLTSVIIIVSSQAFEINWVHLEDTCGLYSKCNFFLLKDDNTGSE